MLKTKAISGAACAVYGVKKKDCKGRPGREM